MIVTVFFLNLVICWLFSISVILPLTIFSYLLTEIIKWLYISRQYSNVVRRMLKSFQVC